jgi:hypothetical protein
VNYLSDYRLRFLLDSRQMIAIPKTLGVDLVYVFRAGWAGREPSVAGNNFDTSNWMPVARGQSQHFLDFLSGEARKGRCRLRIASLARGEPKPYVNSAVPDGANHLETLAPPTSLRS